ncbi:MAG: hypothetical protein WBB82_10210 [Limnothrix sp.]
MAATKQGKAIASHNSTKHGIYSQKPPTTDDQDLELYEQTKAGLIAEFEPQTITEDLQIEQIVMARVRLHRLWRAESAMIQRERLSVEIERITPPRPPTDLELLLEEMNPKVPTPPPELEKILNQLYKQNSAIEPDLLGIISEDKTQLRLQREEGHLQRTIDKGIKYLQQQRDRRNGSNPTTVEAIANS